MSAHKFTRADSPLADPANRQRQRDRKYDAAVRGFRETRLSEKAAQRLTIKSADSADQQCVACTAPLDEHGAFAGDADEISTISCPKCGAPLRHVPADPHGSLDEGWGDSDALEELEGQIASRDHTGAPTNLANRFARQLRERQRRGLRDGQPVL